MKKVFTLIASICTALGAFAQTNGWPANYSGVMLQGFYWDSYNQSKWTRLEKQADDFTGYFNLVWVPQSGKTLNPTRPLLLFQSEFIVWNRRRVEVDDTDFQE